MKVTHLHYHSKSKILDITFDLGMQHSLSAEFLRVHSPSAEVRGHGQPKLVANKKAVGIAAIEPAGHYSVKLCFDDGHDTGLYRWEYLYELCQNEASLWQDYLTRLKAAKATREPVIPIQVKL